MRTCEICGNERKDPSVLGWCSACCKSYDRAHQNDDGTVHAVATWAAGRARREMKKRMAPTVKELIKDLEEMVDGLGGRMDPGTAKLIKRAIKAIK